MRTKIMLLALITVAVSLVAASFATAQTTFKLKAAMNIGQETTRVKGAKAGAAGRFTATLNGTTLKWTLTFKNLSGSATAAHIHTAPRGVAGPVTVPLCSPVHLTRERDDRAYGGSGERPPGREGLRERSHRKEPRRRDSRADHQGAHEVEVALPGALRVLGAGRGARPSSSARRGP